MTCGFNPVCYVITAFAPFWFWIQIGFWIVVALAALWALSKLKEIGGWPAVGAALIASAAAGGYIVRARQDRVQGQGQRGGYMLTEENVASLQRALAAPGRRFLKLTDVDGKWGPKTKAAVMALQASLTPPEKQTGTLTPRVLNALGLKFG